MMFNDLFKKNKKNTIMYLRSVIQSYTFLKKAMEKSDANSFMVLFRDHNGSKFRGLYAFFHEIEEVLYD